jgi:hypothetical protein
MQNLAAVVTPEAIKEALEEVRTNRPNLIKSTKFHLIYKNEPFPPKEIVRIAAKKMGISNLDEYRLNGGNSTNDHLIDKGFKIVQYRDWQNQRKNYPENEQRIARLTFNKNGWQFPSGWEGKSRAKGSYETKNGYGHEEWLFDFTKLIDGYHYGFLEPVNANFKKYNDQVFDIYLYTVNSLTNERFWVGKLNNAEVIDEQEADEIRSYYIKKGWYKEMLGDLKKLELDATDLGNWKGSGLFNIRFKPEDFEEYPKNTYVSKDDNSISSYHYVLLHVIKEPKIEVAADGEFILGRCNPDGRFTGKTIIKKYEERLIEYPALHHQISKELEKILKNDYDNVYPEHQTGFGTSVDIVAVKGKQTHFFEIKTYNDVRTCLRQAIGQLLEYSYFPDKQIADELIIVTQHLLQDRNTLNYVKHLKKHLGLPLRYMCYDLEKKKIVQLI